MEDDCMDHVKEAAVTEHLEAGGVTFFGIQSCASCSEELSLHHSTAYCYPEHVALGPGAG